MSVKLTLEIENHYEEIEPVTNTVTVVVPKPPQDKDSDEFDEWREDHIFPHTGTGHETGNSSYFVKVIASEDAALVPVGTEWEWV